MGTAWTLLLLLLDAADAARTKAPPPVMDAVFTAPFREYFAANASSTKPPPYALQNVGAWIVRGEYGAYIHGKGQRNNFCSCANQTGAAASSECRLLFSPPPTAVDTELVSSPVKPDGWMRVFYPGSGFCCKLCSAADGCGLLRPDWLRRASANFTGEVNVGGRRCERWTAHGAVATDEWLGLKGDPSVPCAYHERFDFPNGREDHALVFDVGAYQRGVADETYFTPPAGCALRCPLVFGQTCY